MSLLDLLRAWDAARARPIYRVGGVLLGLGLATAVVLAPTPTGLSPEGQRAAALTVAMGLWWLGGVLPMAVTALVPLVAVPLLGLGGAKEAAAPYADPLNVLMLGGFLLAFAMEEVGLHRRVVTTLTAPDWVRASPRRVGLALMVAAASLSCFVNNTATMLMMLPIALGLAEGLRGDPALWRRARSAYTLGTAYACSIGGVGTLVGTAPNAVFAGLAPKLAGRDVSFADWLPLGLSFVALALPLAWIVVTRLVYALPDTGAAPRRAAEPWTRGQGVVAAAGALCLALWVTRGPVNAGVVAWGGWGAAVPGKVDDGTVVIAIAALLFVLPRVDPTPRGPEADDPLGDDAAEGRFLLSWRRAARAVPWSVLLLMGGGFSLAAAIQGSGLSGWAAGGMSGLGALPPAAQTLAICLSVAFLSAFTSNTATTQIALPLLGAGAAAAGVDPILWMAPATISASCDFALAVGTPPNAIAAESGEVSPADMAFAGVILNVACAFVASFVVLVVGV